jgi:polyhydroxyalkanoate synthesis regulator phasin
MSDRTKLLKKAVLTGVGATANVDRVKDALNEAMQDLVKVGRDLFEDLEEKGKVKTDTVESFLKGLQDEAAKRTGGLEAKVNAKVGKNVKKAAKDFGLVTLDEYEDLLARVTALEVAQGISHPSHEAQDGEDHGDNHDHAEQTGRKKKTKGQ